MTITANSPRTVETLARWIAGTKTARAELNAEIRASYDDEEIAWRQAEWRAQRALCEQLSGYRRMAQRGTLDACEVVRDAHQLRRDAEWEADHFRDERAAELRRVADDLITFSHAL